MKYVIWILLVLVTPLYYVVQWLTYLIEWIGFIVGNVYLLLYKKAKGQR